MSNVRASKCALISMLIGLCGVPAVRASFYDIEIEQVIAGVQGDTTAQAIQLRIRVDSPNNFSPIRLVVRNSDGTAPIVLYDFDSPIPSSTAGKRILIATPNLSLYTSSPIAPDFFLENLIPEEYFAAGTLTLETDIPDDPTWRLSWGGADYHGPGTGLDNNDPDANFNPAFDGPLPTTSRSALRFKFSEAVDSTNNANDYELTPGPATFINNDNDSGTITTSSKGGACCHGHGCDFTNAIDCFSLPGIFGGEGTQCDVDACAKPPSNDNCSDAIPIQVGLTPFSSFGATTDGADEPGCFGGFNEAAIRSDVWFTFHSDCDGLANLSLCNSNYDTKVIVYTGTSCDTTGAALVCNDDFCGNPDAPFQSFVSFPIQTGQSYLIRVGGYRGAQGAGVFELTTPGCAPPPPPTPEPPACCNMVQVRNGDWDGDCDFDLRDLAALQTCIGRDGIAPPGGCLSDGCSFMDANGDGRIDGADYHLLSPTIHGPGSLLAGCDGNAGSCDAWMTTAQAEQPFGGNYYVFGNPDFPPPGYDGQNGNPPIPAGFFGPGSLPFDGVVEFLGQPLDAPNTAGTDTLIEHPPLRFGFGDLPLCDIVPARLRSLSLRSTPPIIVYKSINTGDCNGNGIEDIVDIIHGLSVDENSNGIPDECEWYVGEELSPASPPDGEIHACKNQDNGGTYDATFHLQPMFVFVNKAALDAGAAPTADNVKILDTSVAGMPPMTFQFFNQPFSICPPNTGNYHTPCSVGNFVPGAGAVLGRGEPINPFSCLDLVATGESQFLCLPECLSDACTYLKSGNPAGQCLQHSCGAASCGTFLDKLYPGSQCTVANTEPCPGIGFFRVGAGECQNACSSPLGACVQFYGGANEPPVMCTETSSGLCP